MTLQALPRQAQETGEGPVAKLLARVAELAVQLHALSLKAEQFISHNVAPVDEELERLSVKFDRAHARAISLGISMETEHIVEYAGEVYLLSLTEDGIEYRTLNS